MIKYESASAPVYVSLLFFFIFSNSKDLAGLIIADNTMLN
jgi:hypothetical protein